VYDKRPQKIKASIIIESLSFITFDKDKLRELSLRIYINATVLIMLNKYNLKVLISSTRSGRGGKKSIKKYRAEKNLGNMFFRFITYETNIL
tara:strand:- start:182 stop:457 length:276 start_codon:yes stop_codon:yes gene_type:complete